RSGPMIYQFGPFELDSRKRHLVQAGVPIPLTPKAFELLIALIESRDRPMTKDELMQKIWPDSFVEEGNLTQNISVLRKALGDSRSGIRYIVTFPGRGYQFVGTIGELASDDPGSRSRSGHDSDIVHTADAKPANPDILRIGDRGPEPGQEVFPVTAGFALAD